MVKNCDRGLEKPRAAFSSPRSQFFTIRTDLSRQITCLWLGGKRGTGYGVPGCGKRGVWWKTRGPVENAGSGGKRGVWWKTRGQVENAGSNVENTGNHYFSPRCALSSLK